MCVDDETPKVEAGLLLILPLVFVQMKFEKQNKTMFTTMFTAAVGEERIVKRKQAAWAK